MHSYYNFSNNVYLRKYYNFLSELWIVIVFIVLLKFLIDKHKKQSNKLDTKLLIEVWTILTPEENCLKTKCYFRLGYSNKMNEISLGSYNFQRNKKI